MYFSEEKKQNKSETNPKQIQELIKSFDKDSAVSDFQNTDLSALYILIISYCFQSLNYIVFWHCRQLSPQDEAILDEIKKASKSVSKNSVEQTAYFWAMGAKNNLDLAKFREQIEQELQATDSSESTEKKGDTFVNIL